MRRYAAKRDSAEPSIIEALENAGYDVRPLDYPCDLAVRGTGWPGGVFQLLEVKTGQGKKLSVKKDKRQQAQKTFLETTRTPIVRTPLEALRIVDALLKP